MCISALAEKTLQQKNIDKDNRLFIDPNNVFWALVGNKKHGSFENKKILSLYNRVKRRIDAAMHDFRFKADLNSVYINVTDKCNANCPYCYIPAAKRRNGKQMSSEELSYVLEKINTYFISRNHKKTRNKPIIIYHGSEPLLAKDMIFSSIKKFKNKFHFGIQTNALLLNKKDADFLKAHKVSVGISLDSLNSKVNDKTRKSKEGSNYIKALSAIKWFNSYEGLNVITTITKYNVKDLPRMVRFLHKKGVTCLLLNPVRATRKSTVKLRPTNQALTKYFIKAVEEAMKLSKENGRRIIIGNFSNIILGIAAPLARRLMCDISPCGGGRCFFAITASGEMVPCGEFIALDEFSGGNIFKTSIKKALGSIPFKKVRSRIVENIAECDVCIYRNICGAPCPAEVYSLSKDLNKISPYCEFYKEVIAYAFGLIARGESEYFFRRDAASNIKYEYRI